MKCLASNPVVNGIEKELGDKAKVVRINLGSSTGMRIAKQFDVSSAGTLIVVNGTGDVVYRKTGMPQRKAIMEAAEEAASG